MERKAMSMTFENATTKSVDVNGTNFVFREIGKKGGVPPPRSGRSSILSWSSTAMTT
jgi:hypothetical protein